mmetsp:Transcript_17864/g.29868  ORF Transcript_17864/g.29868 Transcript_17864/m.29868 type:complete len:443 (-) Transcript_17864:157-1485(-)
MNSTDVKCTKACFQCGEQGHTKPDCVLKEQSKAGLDAHKRYQKAWLAAKRPKKTKPKLHHFLKFQEWMRRHAEAGVVVDPLVLVANRIQDSAGQPLGFELTKMLQLSYKEIFMDIVERTRLRFSGETTKKDHDELWEQALNQAVKAGAPADFGQVGANRVYADNKLVFRTRYLYHLIMDDNPFSVKLRTMLLPAIVVDGDSASVAKRIHVASCGGGPGFDHLAVCLAAWFLCEVQRRDADEVTTTRTLAPTFVHTDIFDLYNEEWAPIVDDLAKAFQQEQQGDEAAGRGRAWRARDVAWWQESCMTMHAGDLRQRAPRDTTVDLSAHEALLLRTVLHTDIFICQFVLHENASFLVDEETGLLVGFVASVLESARIGAMLVCTDSGHTLWPALKDTARQHGWEFWSDDENAQSGRKIVFGPKAFVILERVDASRRLSAANEDS